MKVKILRGVAAARRAYTAGSVVDLPDWLAVRWCEEGVAEPVDPAELESLLAEESKPDGEEKAQEGPPETKAHQAPSEDKEAGVTEDAGDAGGSEGNARKSAGRRRAAGQSD
jgi:hypothetical protein